MSYNAIIDAAFEEFAQKYYQQTGKVLSPYDSSLFRVGYDFGYNKGLEDAANQLKPKEKNKDDIEFDIAK